MLCAEFMVSARNGTLQEAPDVLNGVGVGILHNVFTLAVFNGFVLSVMVPDTFIRGLLKILKVRSMQFENHSLQNIL